MRRYPVELSRDGDSMLVRFPDAPEAITFGESEQDALAHAVDALETAMISYMEDKRDIPRPSPRRGRPSVALPALSEAKIALYELLREAGVRKAELARRLGWHMPQVDRLLDLRHKSRLDQLEAAFRALGRRLTIEVVNAA